MSFWKKLFGVKESPHADIHDAARHGDLKKVKSLLRGKPDLVFSKEKISGGTPLHEAAHSTDYKECYRDVVSLLLAKGADVNARNKYGDTPLHVAAEYSYIELGVVEVLLKNGADVNARNDSGKTPLHEAHFKEKAASLLLEKGADVNARDNSGRTPMHYADFKKGVALLIARGAEIEAKDNKGQTPLHMAVVDESDINMIAKIMAGDHPASGLIASGADVNAKDNNGQTPLHIAASQGRLGIIKYELLGSGAEINAEDNDGKTPFDRAVSNGHKDMADFLSQHGGRKGVFPPKQTYQPSPTQSAVKDEDLSFEALVEELVSLSQAGYDWGQQNRFPAVKNYPQYPRIRRLGELIYAQAGYAGMQQACHVLRQRVVVREGGGQYLAEHGWAGIGDWRP